jgi:hypothetical protein
MFSFCCNAHILLPIDSDTHLIIDWYECSRCGKPCDKVKISKGQGSLQDEQF